MMAVGFVVVFERPLSDVSSAESAPSSPLNHCLREDLGIVILGVSLQRCLNVELHIFVEILENLDAVSNRSVILGNHGFLLGYPLDHELIEQLSY
jgi:hypothetical protein